MTQLRITYSFDVEMPRSNWPEAMSDEQIRQYEIIKAQQWPEIYMSMAQGEIETNVEVVANGRD